MLRVILIIIIFIVLYRIYLLKYSDSFDNTEGFINITNPFVSGLSQFQLGSNRPDKTQMLVNLPNEYDELSELSNETNAANEDYSETDYKVNPNNVLNRTNRIKQINRLANSTNYNTCPSKSKINQDVKMISNMIKQKNKSKVQTKPNMAFNMIKKPCVKLNKFFVETQFNDAYRDVMTSINQICPDQKILFNLQSLPVVSTLYDVSKRLPVSILKLVNQFLVKLNMSVKSLPESGDIINDFNNYLPLASDLKKYVENKGINKFYKDIGVDFNLYADTPPNAPVEFVQITAAKRELTDAETKYVISFAIKKVLESVKDQMKLTVHFVIKNNPLEGENLFFKTITSSLNTTQQVAIEFVFIDGYYTNDYNADYDCYAQDNSKKISNTDGADNFFSFKDLGEDTMLNDNEIITQLNKKYREHEIEMSNFNVNVPYPIYQNKANAVAPSWPN